MQKQRRRVAELCQPRQKSRTAKISLAFREFDGQRERNQIGSPGHQREQEKGEGDGKAEADEWCSCELNRIIVPTRYPKREIGAAARGD